MSQAFNEIWHSWSVDNEYFPFTSKNKALPCKIILAMQSAPFLGGSQE